MKRICNTATLLVFFIPFQFAYAQQKQPLEVYIQEKIEFEGSTDYSVNLLRSKVERLFAKHDHITLSGKNAPFIIEPSINIIDKEIMTSAPPMIAFKIELNLTFSSAYDDKVFASTSINLRGVGTSDNKAYSNAFSNIRHGSKKFEAFTAKGLEEISKHYNASCEKIIAQAENYISYDNYAAAINLLFSVPFGVEPCHERTLEVLTNAYKGYQDKTCSKYIDIARIAVSIRDFQSATNVLVKIDPNSTCSDEMKEITAQMGEDIKERYERKWAVYENAINNKQQLEEQRIGAIKELFSSIGSNYSQRRENEYKLLNDSTKQKNENRSGRESNFLQLNVISPVSKKNNGKVYTASSSQNVYGFISDHQRARSLTINGSSVKWNEQGVFRNEQALKVGENYIHVELTGKDSKKFDRQLKIIKVKNEEKNDPPESSLIPVTEQSRIALVIGNSHYEYVAPLKNPSNDASDITKTLKQLNFNVTTVLDAGYDKMRSSFIDFSRKLNTSDVALIFFAGHGLEIDGINYLVPVDAKIESEQDVIQYTLSVDKILSAMKYANDENLNILILDACRNNPFPTGKRGGGGLARAVAPSGMIIAYATEPGATASDGDGENGLYTGELIKQMNVSQRIEDVFMNTRNMVEQKTNGGQQPWEEARLKGVFYLKNE